MGNESIRGIPKSIREASGNIIDEMEREARANCDIFSNDQLYIVLPNKLYTVLKGTGHNHINASDIARRSLISVVSYRENINNPNLPNYAEFL